jgi:hypothetical protein
MGRLLSGSLGCLVRFGIFHMLGELEPGLRHFQEKDPIGWIARTLGPPQAFGCHALVV